MNQLLRDHVTRVGFSLQLSRSQIAALVDIVHNLAFDEEGYEHRHHLEPLTIGYRRFFGNFVTGARCLEDRGLIVWHRAIAVARARGVRSGELRPSEIWEITPAGWLVVGLLKESGIWAEFDQAAPCRSCQGATVQESAG